MVAQTSCPDLNQLQALLEPRTCFSEQANLVGHLDSCSSCQEVLQNLANQGPWHDPAVRHIDRDQPPVGSAYWKAIADLGSGTTPLPAAKPALADMPTSATAPSDPSSNSVSDSGLHFLAPPEEPGTLGKLERFHVLRMIGRGGMGIVLEALDACLQRKVAIKVMDPQLARDEVSRKRFCREARAAAAVAHENVVAIHQVDIDETHDLPYLVMQFVAGESLQELLDRTAPLPLMDILRVGVQTARGLAAAHAQGLIHRDIKPANILLVRSENDQVTAATPGPALCPVSLATVKITDFGLARSGEDLKLTRSGFVAGTPLYMAPEQARGEELDHRTDLFSLGGVLYAMCTGKPPFEASTPYLVLRRVTDEHPEPIEKLNPDVPEWLVDLIEQLLDKNPAQRIQTASEVATILGRHLIELKAAQAAPASATNRRLSRTGFRRLRRAWWQPALIGLSAFLIPTALLVLTETTGWTHLFSGRSVIAESPGGPNGISPMMSLPGNAGRIWAVCYVGDTNILAMASDEGVLKLWNLETGRVVATLNGHKGPVRAVSASQDGKLLASASEDGTVILWDAVKRERIRTIENQPLVRSVVFTPDGQTLVTGSSDSLVHRWVVATGKELPSFKGHQGVVNWVDISPDGKTLASASSDKTIKLWDLTTGQEQVTLGSNPHAIYAAVFSPDGKTLASASGDGAIRIWETATGNALTSLKGYDAAVRSLAFSPDGRRLAASDEDHNVMLWDLTTGQQVGGAMRGHTAIVFSVAYAPDGNSLASAGGDGMVKLWDVSRP